MVKASTTPKDYQSQRQESAHSEEKTKGIGVWNSMAPKMESPLTPGRPLFNFSTVSRKKSVPSKWDDAEKWLFSGVSKENISSQKQNIQVFSDKSRVFIDCQIKSSDSSLDIPFKDKFTDEKPQLNPNSILKNPSKKNEEIGTNEMTPLESSTSPARHNTPASRSGPLNQSGSIHEQLQSGLARFDTKKTQWSSREDEEEEISKSLRHFEMGRRSFSVSGPRASAWELQEEKSKFCVRYQREEAKIQAWVNLQTAKAEAQTKKLEVKIQKMRSELEEKLMKRMGIVHRKSQEWRAAAQLEHCNNVRRTAQHNSKSSLSCACLLPM